MFSAAGLLTTLSDQMTDETESLFDGAADGRCHGPVG